MREDTQSLSLSRSFSPRDSTMFFGFYNIEAPKGHFFYAAKTRNLNIFLSKYQSTRPHLFFLSGWFQGIRRGAYRN
jgi:hypothetical protein